LNAQNVLEDMRIIEKQGKSRQWKPKNEALVEGCTELPLDSVSISAVRE